MVANLLGVKVLLQRNNVLVFANPSSTNAAAELLGSSRAIGNCLQTSRLTLSGAYQLKLWNQILPHPAWSWLSGMHPAPPHPAAIKRHRESQQRKIKETGAGRRNRECHHLRRHGEVKTLIRIQDGGTSSGTATVIDSTQASSAQRSQPRQGLAWEGRHLKEL